MENLTLLTLCVLVSGSTLEAQTIEALAETDSSLYAATSGEGVFRSTDTGQSWTSANGGLTERYVMDLAVLHTYLLASTGVGVFRSTNSGLTWTSVNFGLLDQFVDCLLVSGDNVFAGTANGLFLSTDSCNNWIATDSTLNNHQVLSLARSGSNLLAGVWSGLNNWRGSDLYLSSDGGKHWSAANRGAPSTGVYCFATRGTSIYAGTLGGGVIRSTDNGRTWTTAGYPSEMINALSVTDSFIVAATRDGIFRSSDNGATWIASNTGLTDWAVNVLLLSGASLYAGSYSKGIFVSNNNGGTWMRLASQPMNPTAVESATTPPPRQIQLDQNYPNPFNPTTVVSYQLSVSSHVKLVVFDLLGREVSILVNEKENAGAHEVTFDGSRLSSGVYFYRLQAGEFVQAKKFILLR